MKPVFIFLLFVCWQSVAQQARFQQPDFCQALDSVCLYSGNNFESLFAENAGFNGITDSITKWPARHLLPGAALAFITKESSDDLAATYLLPLTTSALLPQLQKELVTAIEKHFELHFKTAAMHKDALMPGGKEVIYTNGKNPQSFYNRAFFVRSYVVDGKNYIGIGFYASVGQIVSNGFYQKDDVVVPKLKNIFNGLKNGMTGMQIISEDLGKITSFSLYGIRGQVESDSITTDVHFYYPADYFPGNKEATGFYMQLVADLKKALNNEIQFENTKNEKGNPGYRGKSKLAKEGDLQYMIYVNTSRNDAGKMNVYFSMMSYR